MTEKRRHLFTLWIPGQVTGGKNATTKKFQQRDDGTWDVKRIPDRRRSKRTGRKEPTPFERYAPPATQFFYYQRPAKPYPGPVRLEIDYWWKDLVGRDEDGRSGVIGNILENAGWVASDGDLRYYWNYKGRNQYRPGVRIRAYTEPEGNPSTTDGNGWGPWGGDRYEIWFPKDKRRARR